MRFFAFALLFSLPLFCCAQYLSLSGSVRDSTGGKALDGASIFLGNTSIGTTSRTDGSFRLTGISPGQYDIIVTMIGYKPFSQTLNIQKSADGFAIKLARKPVMMSVVSIMSKTERKRLMNMFMRDFIGDDGQQRQCRIKNPDELFLEYDRKSNTLTASTEKFLIIENTFLGYRLNYLLSRFSSNYTERRVFFAGQALFKDLPGGPAKQKRWKKNRENTFAKSPMRFFRSLIASDTSIFGMYTLIRKPNPVRPPDSLIRAKQDQFRFNPDSMAYWSGKAGLPKEIQQIIDTPRGIDDVLARTDLDGIYALRFSNLLYVAPHQKKQGENGLSSRMELLFNDEQSSILHLLSRYALFDQNGVILTPENLIYEGNWAKDRIGQLLPYNYEIRP